MDAQTEYYVRKYNNLLEQIKKLEHENKLLEDLTAGGIGSGSSLDDDDFSTTIGSGSSLDDDDFSTTIGSGSSLDDDDFSTTIGSGSGSETNPDIGRPYNPPKPTEPRYHRLRGTRLIDIGLDSRRDPMLYFSRQTD